jgi:hypothetical protein
LDEKLDAFARRLESDVGKLVDIKVAALCSTDTGSGSEALDRPYSQRSRRTYRHSEKKPYADQANAVSVPESCGRIVNPAGSVASSMTGPPLKVTTNNSVPLAKANQSAPSTLRDSRGFASSDVLQELLHERLTAGPIDLHSYLDFELDPLPLRKTLPTVTVAATHQDITVGDC